MNIMKKTILFIIGIIFLPGLVFGLYLLPPELALPRLETTLVYQGVVSGQYSDPVELKALLKEKASGNVVPNKKIEFILEDQTITAHTDINGTAIVSLILDQAAGAYSLLTIFAGDSAFHGSSDSDAFQILKEETTLVYTGPLSGDQDSYVVLSAQLSEKDGVIGDLKDKTIIFELGGLSDRATTDSAGKASVNMELDISPGTYTLITKFEGDAFYLSSSDSDSFEVTAIPGNENRNGCFIATVLYGPSASETEMFRQFRDRYLLTNPLGRLFVSGYYKFSPFLSDFVSENQKLKNMAKRTLEPIIRITTLFVD